MSQFSTEREKLVFLELRVNHLLSERNAALRYIKAMNDVITGINGVVEKITDGRSTVGDYVRAISDIKLILANRVVREKKDAVLRKGISNDSVPKKPSDAVRELRDGSEQGTSKDS